MKTIVVIPTYDEKDNVGPMAETVLKNDVELLFVDDNSPDGTGAVIDALAAKEPRIHVLHREKKEGLGRAYVAGFSKALELGADLVVQMDCDFSHDPKDVARLVDAISTPIPGKPAPLRCPLPRGKTRMSGFFPTMREAGGLPSMSMRSPILTG